MVQIWNDTKNQINSFVSGRKTIEKLVKIIRFLNGAQTPIFRMFGFQKFEVFENLDYPTLDLTQQKNYVLFSANMCTEDFFHLNEK